MSGTPIRLLIVEDSTITANQLCEFITAAHPQVHCSTAESETEAVAKIASDRFDVVVVDLALREGTGFGVLKHVVALRPKPLAVVLTNYALPNYREFAMLNGADYFLDKAISMEELPKILAKHLKSYQ